MPRLSRLPRRPLATYLQMLATGLVAALAVAAAAFTIAGFLGAAPMLRMPLAFGDTVYSQAGPAIQGGVVVVLLAILASLPSGFRVLSLERTHRDFAISMSDVAEAYRTCHAADRAGAFSMSSEFDSVKERILHLRNHPDLGSLEPDVIEAAALMSQVSRRLAYTYSDEALSRARAFLDQRQEEIEAFKTQLAKVTGTCRRLKLRLEAIEAEEEKVGPRLAELDAEFGELLHQLGYVREEESRPGAPDDRPTGAAPLFDAPRIAAAE